VCPGHPGGRRGPDIKGMIALRGGARGRALERWSAARQDVEDQERPGGRWMTAPQ
jgi:hypothetical protein